MGTRCPLRYHLVRNIRSLTTRPGSKGYKLPEEMENNAIRRPSPRMSSFHEQKEICEALWHYQCSPRLFLQFAQKVYKNEDASHFRKHAKDWIFIAIVFEMRDICGYSAMEMVGPGDLPTSEVHGQDVFRRPYRQRVPRLVIGMNPPQKNRPCY